MEAKGFDKKTLFRIGKKLKSKAAYLKKEGYYSQSRRCPGAFAYSEVDTSGYKNVMFYIQKGFGVYDNVVLGVTKKIIELQYDMGIGYFFCMFSFGWEDEPLKHTGSGIYLSRKGNTKLISKKMCDLASIDAPEHDSIITSLFPQAALYSRLSKVKHEDLLVFFCKNRSVFMNKKIASSYKYLKRRSLWVFFDGDTLEWEFGFKPEVVESHDTEGHD